MAGLEHRTAGDGIVVIDTEYVRPRMDASHLIVDEGRAAFIDTGTVHSVPHLLAALDAERIDPENVEYVILTHVHLDHAGGAGRLIESLPAARVLVHPRGAAHIVDPAILVAASRRVYGEPRFTQAYGDIVGVPVARVEIAKDGERIGLGRRTLELIHTPGHALHHLCIIDRERRQAFTGDTFGVSYRELDTPAGEFVFPTTTPSQFDPAQLHASIDRILRTDPLELFLTHYGRVGRAEKLGADLHADIDAFASIARSVAHDVDRVARMEALLFEHLSVRLDAHGYAGDAQERHSILNGDIELNAAGLDAWLSRCGA